MQELIKMQAKSDVLFFVYYRLKLFVRRIKNRA